MNVPHHYENEELFIEQFLQCNTEVAFTLRFRADMVHHLYPHSKQEDEYIHAPLIDRDEMSNEGMLLINVALLEILGLLKKEPNGKFSLGPNAKQRIVFMHGDALSVSLYGNIYDKILCNIMQLGKEKYVRTLLDAQERIFIQKGHFHQLMHYLGAIYTQFYGAFMQPFQVANGVKRVTGDPVKNGFQCHERFADKMYNACNRFMLRMFCTSQYMEVIRNASHEHSNIARLRFILDTYREYRESWELSEHQPSRMVALFIKSYWCYLRCKKAISSHDGWHLEIESCHLMPVWKVLGKTTYLRLQCKYMEMFYSDKKVPSIYQEFMRANVFCVKLSSRVVVFDEQNENYNLCLKQTPTTSSLDVAIMWSRHVMAGDKAAKELRGVPTRRDRTRGTSLADDTLELEGVLFAANVFVRHTPTPMDTNYFWKLIGAKVNVGSARDHNKTTVPLTEHERGG
jgi:hypothetical protein